MSDAIGNDNEDLLSLTLHLDTDDDEFSKAKNQIKQLQDTLKDATSSLDFVSDLNKAVQALRTAVKLWNSLESKAVSFVDTRGDYSRYSLTSGEKETLTSRLAEDKIAKKSGLTVTGVENAISTISNEQGSPVWHGEDIKTKEAVTLTSIGRELGWSRLQGSALSDLMLHTDPKEVYLLLEDAYAELYRKIVAAPNKKEQQRLRELAEKMPYLDEGSKEYTRRRVENKYDIYAQSGTPIRPFFSYESGDVGTFGPKADKLAAEVVETQNELAALRAHLATTGTYLSSKLYVGAGTAIAAPLKIIVDSLKVMTGQKMGGLGGIGLRSVETNAPFGATSTNVLKSLKTGQKKQIAATAGMGPKFTEVLNEGERTKEYLSEGLRTDLPDSPLSALYKEAMLFEARALHSGGFNEYLSAFYATIADKMVDAGLVKNRDAALKELSNPKSDYYLPLKDASIPEGFTSAYASGIISEEEYANALVEIVNFLKHNEINKAFNVDSGKEVTAKSSGEGKETRIILEIRDEATGMVKETAFPIEEVHKLFLRK